MVYVMASIGDFDAEVRALVLVEGDSAYVGVVEAFVDGAWIDLYASPLRVSPMTRERLEETLVEAAFGGEG